LELKSESPWAKETQIRKKIKKNHKKIGTDENEATL
jgi:hypothetical protein